MLAIKKIIFLLFLPLLSIAQSDSIVTLKTIEINSVRSANKNIGFKTLQFDSLTIQNKNDLSLSELLSEKSSAYLKDYGPGALSTISLRGGSAYHTTVLWNGFPLANQMNGVMDLHLLPIFLFENIDLQYGGSSAIWGSGAISGALHINDNNLINQNNSIKIGTSYNDASCLTNYAAIKIRQGKISSTVKYFQLNEKNNFSFLYNGKLNKQIHADYFGYGLILENSYLINNNSTFSFNLWHQYASRNIAPSLTELKSDAVQRDNNLRYSLIFSTNSKLSHFIFRNAYFNESIYFNDDVLVNPSMSLCKTFISEPEYQFFINDHHSFQTGINLTSIRAISSEYTKTAAVDRNAIYFSYKFQTKSFSASLSLRKEYSTIKNAPLTYSIGFDYSITTWLKIFGNAGSVFRNPQVNDLYWVPGGNINLLPEKGFTEEGTIDLDVYNLFLNKKSDSISFHFEFTFFNKNIDNWIAWTPHGTIWYPTNIKSVHSYGTESKISYKKVFSKLTLSSDFFYAYSISQTTSSLLNFDASINKQLIYVPYDRAGFNFKCSTNHFGLDYSFSYTGIRFTSTDNLASLDPYSLNSIQLNYFLKRPNTQWNLFARISNMFNENYTSVVNHPQPLRNYSIGISIQVNPKIKNN